MHVFTSLWIFRTISCNFCVLFVGIKLIWIAATKMTSLLWCAVFLFEFDCHKLKIINIQSLTARCSGRNGAIHRQSQISFFSSYWIYSSWYLCGRLLLSFNKVRMIFAISMGRKSKGLEADCLARIILAGKFHFVNLFPSNKIVLVRSEAEIWPKKYHS